MSYEFNVLYYINIYKGSRRTIFFSVGAAMLLTFCFSLFAPTVYVSTATLLATKEVGSANYGTSAIASLLGISSSTSFETAAAIMTSRRMANDVRDHFKGNEKPRFWWKINSSKLQAGVIEVTGSDPTLTQEIANFCIENLDKINMELDITPIKPMVKVLDAAAYGSPLPKQILRKMFISGMLTFMLISLYIFFTDYFKKLKGQ